MGAITFGYPPELKEPKIIVTLSDHGWFAIKDYTQSRKAKYVSKQYKSQNGEWKTEINPEYAKSIIVSGDLKYELLGEQLYKELFDVPYDEYKDDIIYDIVEELEVEDLKRIADILFERYKNYPHIKKLLKEEKE